MLKCTYTLALTLPMSLNPLKLSVIVPVYNSEKHLEACLKSIESQENADFELIIIDDGSTDKSLELIYDFKARSEIREDITIIVKPVNKGTKMALYDGFEAASGEYICIVDSDDILPRFALQSTIEFMDNNPTCDLSWSLYEAMDEDGSNLRLGKRSKAPRPTNQTQVIIQNLTHFVSFHLMTVRACSYTTSFVKWDNMLNGSAIDYEFVLSNMFNNIYMRHDRVNYYYRTNVHGSMSSNRAHQSHASKAARDRALVRAINEKYITGEDVVKIQNNVRFYQSSKRKPSVSPMG